MSYAGHYSVGNPHKFRHSRQATCHPKLIRNHPLNISAILPLGKGPHTRYLPDTAGPDPFQKGMHDCAATLTW